MTAVVAILNKTGMALAADSAATITNGNNSQSKVFNTANKVFTLSKYHPVAILIYNNSEFLSTPWELIIKLYRKELRKKSFRTVKEYSEDFRKFLLKNQLLNFKAKEKNFLENNLYRIVQEVIENIRGYLIDQNDLKALSLLKGLENCENPSQDDVDIIKQIADKLEGVLEQNIKDYNSCPKSEGLSEFDLEIFNKSNKGWIHRLITDMLMNSMPSLICLDNIEDLKVKIADLFISILQSKINLSGSTGLVFVGYGSDQIYPALYSIETDGIVNGALRYSVSNEVVISDHDTCNLVPFAQTDVMNTFLRGMNPDIYNIIKDSLDKSLSSTLDTYNSTIVENTEGEIDKTLLKTLKQDFKENIMSSMQNDIESVLHNSHIQPTLQALRFLSKEDLAELAESLIYLTFLKRRTTSSLESVGGAIDVAIISKGDGFIWKKRKHYFEDKLNQHFFQNYFN